MTMFAKSFRAFSHGKGAGAEMGGGRKEYQRNEEK